MSTSYRLTGLYGFDVSIENFVGCKLNILL